MDIKNLGGCLVCGKCSAFVTGYSGEYREHLLPPPLWAQHSALGWASRKSTARKVKMNLTRAVFPVSSSHTQIAYTKILLIAINVNISKCSLGLVIAIIINFKRLQLLLFFNYYAFLFLSIDSEHFLSIDSASHC